MASEYGGVEGKKGALTIHLVTLNVISKRFKMNNNKKCSDLGSIGDYSAMYTKIQNVSDTSAMFSACSHKHRRCNIRCDDIADGLVLAYIAVPSLMLADVPELFCAASEILRRCFRERWKSYF